MIDAIEKRVTEFWQSIKLNKPPPADFALDADLMAKLYNTVDEGSRIDLSADKRLAELCRLYRDWADEAKAAKDTADAAKAEILSIVQDHETVKCGTFRLKSWEIGGAPDRIITSTDVGQTIKGRKGHRQIRITEKEEA